MLDILKNFDAVEGGKKTSAPAEVGNMKAILESFDKVDECGGMESMEMAAPAQGQPVTVNVTASGKENVADLIALMQQAAGIEQHVDMPMAHDAHVDVDSHNSAAQDAGMAAMKQAIMGTEESVEEEDYANEPDEEYKDHNYMTKDLSGGINRRKKAYKAAQPGDNAMATESIKDRLWAALNEKKVAEGRGRGKKKKMEDIKTTEGRGRGRGKKKK